MTKDGVTEKETPRRDVSVAVQEPVPQTVPPQVRQRVLRLLGLGMRSRGVIVGVNQVREAAKRNKVLFAVVAIDVSQNSLDKLVPLLNARRVKFIEVSSASELGAAVGREQAAVVGIVDRQLAAGVRELVSSAQTGHVEEDV